LQSDPNLDVTNRQVNGNGVGPARTNVSATEEKSSLKSLVRNAKGEAERIAIAQALEQTHWNRKAAARLLNISYRGLLYKIQEYRLAPPAWQSR
jgi:two-component system, NtrC family, response regulator AtoC